MFGIPVASLIKWGIYAALAIAVVSGFAWWRHSLVQQGYDEAENLYKPKLEACQNSFANEVSKWKAQVETQQRELAAFKAQKDATVNRQFEMFKEGKKKQETNKKVTDNEIKATIHPTDVVTLPLAVVRVYNHAVSSSGVAEGNETEGLFTKDSTGIVSKVVTFDAPTFTEVIKGNVDKYNELAGRCDRLVDIVVELEKLNENTDTGRVEVPPDAIGRGFLDGYIATHLGRPD